MTKEERLHNEVKTASSINGFGKTRQLHTKESNWTTFIPHIKINSKCFKDLNVRPETMKFLEENIGSKLFNISFSNIFFNTSPHAKETKAKMNKWNYI